MYASMNGSIAATQLLGEYCRSRSTSVQLRQFVGSCAMWRPIHLIGFDGNNTTSPPSCYGIARRTTKQVCVELSGANLGRQNDVESQSREKPRPSNVRFVSNDRRSQRFRGRMDALFFPDAQQSRKIIIPVDIRHRALA